MSSRAEQKAAAKAAREAAEAEAAAKAARQRRLRVLLSVLGVAVLAVIVVIALTSGGDDGGTPADDGDTVELGIADQLAGFPSKGVAVGDPKAPLTLEEFGDLQCPFCAEFTRSALPAIVDEYVKTGKVRLVFHPLGFLGPDSQRAAQVAAAAALQDKVWPFIEVFYSNQGEENTGYVTEEFLRRIAEATPGLDADKALKERNTAEARKILADARSRQTEFGVDSTPSFLLGETGTTPKRLEVESLEADAFRGPIDEALKAAGE